MSFAGGEILWNVFYPVVLSYLIGLSASLDPRGRWAVLAGSASSLGVACGPVTGSLLSQYAGYGGMGFVLCALLLLVAAPLSAVALHTSGRPLVPGSIRRRGGAPAAVVAGRAGRGGGGCCRRSGCRSRRSRRSRSLRARRRRKVLAS